MTTAVANQTTLSSSQGLMDDTESKKLSQQKDPVSERGLVLSSAMSKQQAPKPVTRAYIWFKADEKDEAFPRPDRDQTKKVLELQGFTVTVFSTNRAFFDHIKKDHSKVHVLMISAHGYPHGIGDLRLIGSQVNLGLIGNQVVITDPSLTKKEQEEGFGDLGQILADKSVVIFDGCSTGHKAFAGNFASFTSQLFPQSTVMAAQHQTVYDPLISVEQDQQKVPSVKRVQFGYSDKDAPVELRDAVVYQNGQEITGQKARGGRYSWRTKRNIVLDDAYYSPTAQKVGKWALRGLIVAGGLFIAYQVNKMRMASQEG